MTLSIALSKAITLGIPGEHWANFMVIVTYQMANFAKGNQVCDVEYWIPREGGLAAGVILKIVPFYSEFPLLRGKVPVGMSICPTKEPDAGDFSAHQPPNRPLL